MLQAVGAHNISPNQSDPSGQLFAYSDAYITCSTQFLEVF